MTKSSLPEKFLSLERHLENADFAAARALLGRLHEGADGNDGLLLELFELQLAVLTKEVEAGLGLTRLVAVMRRAPSLQYAKELYQKMSALAYNAGHSSPSHSHPPPPSAK